MRRTRPKDVTPLACDLHIRLVHEPAIADRVPARLIRIREEPRETLHPPKHRDVIDLDTPLREQFLDVATREPISQVPAHRRDNGSPPGTETRETPTRTPLTPHDTDESSSGHPDPRNDAAPTQQSLRGHALRQNLRRGHYEIGVDARSHRRVARAFSELARTI
jgi:hypothetical protein